MTIWMDVDTALGEVPVNVFPLTDDTDFKTRETAIAYNEAGMDLVWNFVTPAGAFTQTAVTPTTAGDYDWAHQGDGMYTIEIPASGGLSINNDTEGFGWFSGVCTGVLPWRGPIIGFRAAGLNDLMVESAYSTTRGLSGTALPNAAADAAGGLPISDAGGLDMDTIGSNVTTLVSRITSTLFSGITSLAEWLGLLGGKQTGDATALTEIKATGAGSGTYDPTTDSLEAVRDRGDAAWSAASSSPFLLQTTTIATLASQTSFTLTAGSADDDTYNNMLAVVTDSATSTQKAVCEISDYTGSSRTVTLKANPGIFTMAAGDTIDIIAVPGLNTLLDGVWDESLSGHTGVGSAGQGLTDLLNKVAAGFGTASPDTLNAFLKSILNKSATAPASVGTYAPSTDSLEALRERLDTAMGAGFTTSTDSLEAIRDYLSASVTPSLPAAVSTSGTGFLSDCVAAVRKLIDEPSTNAKYTDANMISDIQTAFNEVWMDVNANTDHPVLVRYNITVSTSQQNYYLPSNVAQVWRVAKINSATNLPEWEVWPGNEHSFTGRGFSIEGNTLRLLSKWRSTPTLEVLYIPSAESSIHLGTAAAATSTTLTLAASATDGSIDDRLQAYAGYVLRILSDDTAGFVQERNIISHNRGTGVLTVDVAWETTPTGTIVYEVVPQYSNLLKEVVCLTTAFNILAAEGNQKRMNTIEPRIRKAIRALRQQISSKNSRFPGYMKGDTIDNPQRLF